MDTCLGTSECDDVLQVLDIKNLQKVLTEDEINFVDMTSLGTLMLLGHTAPKGPEESNEYQDEDADLQRLSLAYERLHAIPKILIEELSSYVKILDISNNEFESLDFLSEFKELTHLICDHNNITSRTVIPFLPKLELLWMNHCKIGELYPWARKLLHSCPSLRYLSLMGNPIAPSFLEGGTFFDYLQYRLYIISLFPNIIHLDDKTVTEDEKREAQEMYHRPLMERLVMRTHKNLPQYLREVSERVSEIFSPVPSFMTPQRNVII